MFIDNSSQYQVMENSIDDRIGRAVVNAVSTVENRRHDAILTVMDKMVFPKFEMAVKSITGLSGHGPNSEVKIPVGREFLGNTGNTPLMLASIRLD